MSARVLIPDGDQRAALACVHSLGNAGFDCYATRPEKGNLAGSNRYCRGVAVAPDPASDSEAFPAFLLEQTARWRIKYRLPITERRRTLRLGEWGGVMWGMAMGLNMGMIGLLVASIFMSVLFYPVFWMAFGMTVALSEGVRRSPLEGRPGRVSRPKAYTLRTLNHSPVSRG